MFRILTAAAAAVLVATPAFAHHPMGGATPATMMEGLLSGFGHPVLGFDHFVFIIAAGLLAAPRARGLILPAAFVIGSFIGSLLHLQSVDLPGGEYLIAGSVVLMGALLVSRKEIGDGLFAAILGLAGLLHGHALAEAIIGAEPTPLVAYLGGLALTQYIIAAGAALAWRVLAARNAASTLQLRRVAGAVVVAVGTFFLVANIAG